jgi:hypothetical protein
MLHRRIWGRDDDKGLCETLNERDLDGKGLRVILYTYKFILLYS